MSNPILIKGLDKSRLLKNLANNRKRNKTMALKAKYVEVFTLISVQCDNCKQMFLPNGIHLELSLAKIESGAEGLHANYIRSQSILCANPSLFIMWNKALLDTKRYQALVSPITKV